MARTLDPDRRSQLHAEARKLRRKGLSYEKIASELGVSKTTVAQFLTGKPAIRRQSWREANREHVRDYEKTRNSYKREWEAGECSQCGGRLSDFRHRNLCAECSLDEHEREYKIKAQRFIELRGEGLLNSEIEQQLGLPYNTVATVLYRARKFYGMDVPPSPWFKAPA